MVDGEPRIVCLACANRDPTVFPYPLNLDIHRNQTHSVAWNEANPERFCPGKALSLRFGKKAVEEYLTHFYSPAS